MTHLQHVVRDRGAVRVADLVEWGREILGRAPEARLEAEVLLASAARQAREWLYANSDLPVRPEEEDAYRSMISERAERGCPVAYLTGKKEFAGIEFRMERGVFIPRPETEGLVERAADILRPHIPFSENEVVVDVGCGSGVIGIALARILGVKVLATDISSQAVDLTNRNAACCGAGSLVRAVVGSLLAPLRDARSAVAPVMIVANPPYVSSGAISGLDRDIVDFEPVRALDGGPEGLSTIRELIREAREAAGAGCWLALEIGAEQEGEVKSLLSSRAWEGVAVSRDLAGLARCVVARRAEVK